MAKITEFAPVIVLGWLAFGGKIHHSLRNTIVREQDYKCICGKEPDHPLEIHHKIPRCFGGSNQRENLIALGGKQDCDCHKKWDNLAQCNHQLPNGTTLQQEMQRQRTVKQADKVTSPI